MRQVNPWGRLHRGRAWGFTLIELLVVIAILIMLIAIILPSLVGGKNAAKLVKCSSNQSQIIKAMGSYAFDNSGTMPYAGAYFDNAQEMRHLYVSASSSLSPKGYQNLGMLEESRQIPGKSQLWFCPLQGNKTLMSSNGDRLHPNCLHKDDAELLAADNSATNSRVWVHNRTGYLRRWFSVAKGGEAKALQGLSMGNVTRGAILADSFSLAADILSGHKDSLNIGYGDGHVERRNADLTPPPVVVPPKANYSVLTALNVSNNAQMEINWESFDR